MLSTQIHAVSNNPLAARFTRPRESHTVTDARAAFSSFVERRRIASRNRAAVRSIDAQNRPEPVAWGLFDDRHF